MKFNVYKVIKILFFCTLLSEAIICSESSVSVSVSAESESNGRFLMNAGFLKKKKPFPVTKISKSLAPQLLKKSLAPQPLKKSQPIQKFQKVEAINLMQKSEALKKTTKDDLNTQIEAKFQKMQQEISTNPNDPKPLDLNIGNGPVWASGWIKYFKYFPTTRTNKLTPNDTPREFVVNGQYDEQYKLHPNFNKKLKSKDELNKELDVYIADKNKFFAKLVRNQLLILSSRNVKMKF
jgi:hypothetical protein